MLNPAESPEVKALIPVVDEIAAETVTYFVDNTHDYANAADDLKRIKATLARLDEVRKGMTAPLDAAKKAIMDFFRVPTARLETAEAAIKRACITFTEAEELKRREAQHKADEFAKREREKLVAQAERAREAGKEGRAAGLEDRAAAVAAPVVAISTPKVDGIKYRTIYKFEVTDASLVPDQYKIVDESALRRVVQALGERASIPGVRVWAEKAMAAGRA